MSPQERALAETEAQLARRSAARIDQFLERPDLGPALREDARTQRDEYRQEAHMIEQSLRIDADPRSPVGILFAFGRTVRFVRRPLAEG